MGDVLAIRVTAWPRNGRLGHRAVGLESSWDGGAAFTGEPEPCFFLLLAAGRRWGGGV